MLHRTKDSPITATDVRVLSPGRPPLFFTLGRGDGGAGLAAAQSKRAAPGSEPKEDVGERGALAQGEGASAHYYVTGDRRPVTFAVFAPHRAGKEGRRLAGL